MKKKIVIVSTYPEKGSRNIGDYLISKSLIELIMESLDAEIYTVWREDNWGHVSELILNADHVFFACLAIRQNIQNVYPYLGTIVDSGVPFSVIAAGTDLPVNGRGKLYAGFSESTCDLLKKVNDRAQVFTTRGVLTQNFCRNIGIGQAELDGDVAFYDHRFDGRKFVSGKDIDRVLISDPHRASAYLPALKVLYEGVSELFPKANISVVQHGVNDAVGEFCRSNRIDCVKIYEDKNMGLDIYDEADLHLGFRVHGHVSALKRKKYSYLLEQDGRGCDYGLTLDRKISIPNYYFSCPDWSFKNVAKLMLRRPLTGGTVSTAPAEQLVSLLKTDAYEGFRKFDGLEGQIGRFNERTVCSVKKALAVSA